MKKSQRATPKVQRWLDILVALLRRTYPMTFAELAEEVPSYADGTKKRDAIERMFERDKDELRAFGVPIETKPVDDQVGYVLRKESFYMPYLALVGAGEPKRVGKHGYFSLKTLAFEPDELSAVADAAARARALGDPQLAGAAASAMRKLAIDLPMAAAAPGDAHLLPSRARPEAAVLEALGAALLARRRVTFDYRVMERDTTESRTVEPWGMFFLHGHWYLAARDPQRGAGRAGLRNFRVSRIANVAESDAPFAVPADFRLSEHARSRQAWELGAGDTDVVTVEFRAESGATGPALRLGEAVPDAPLRRRFHVRRPDTFARWVLAFGGDARPVEPTAAVDAFRALVERTRAVYADDVPATVAADVGPRYEPVSTTLASPPTGKKAAPPKSAASATDAAAQLRRLLELVPKVADGRPRPIATLASMAGTDGKTLLRDLKSLADRVDAPGGFVEGLEIYLDGEEAEVRTPYFLRPMRLTAAELRALELGLAMLAGERPPEEGRAIDGARTRLRQALARVNGDDDAAAPLHAGAAALDEAQRELLATLRRARLARRRVRIAYRKAAETASSERVVCPYALVAASGAWYLVARADGSGLRIFRLDRVQSATVTDETFALPADFRVDEVLRDGRAFQSDVAPRPLVVRYGPAVARWIAEREGGMLDEDGSVTVTHPLADVDWAVRHVLQYGADAEVLAPADAREAIVRRLDAMLAGGAAR